MTLRQIIRTDIAASAIVHVSLLALVVLISEVHPFQAAPSEAVMVDIVRPDELTEKAPEPESSPQMPTVSDPAPLAKTEVSNTPPPAAPPVTAQSQEQTAPPRHENQREPNAQPQAAQPAQSYTPPEPDITVKYGVMLGLPENITLAANHVDKSDGGDANASTAAELPSGVIAEFRRHLRKCSKLPASIGPSDNVVIRMRAVMTTDGRLATNPILLEASASAKGPILMQSARSALVDCQPYTMLPADKYGEWKVMDLTFTPQDFDAP